MGYDPANKSINILLRALNSISLLRYAVAMQKRFHFWFSYFRIFNAQAHHSNLLLPCGSC